MKRRTFVRTAAHLLLVVAPAAFAQRANKIYRIGVLRQYSPPVPGGPPSVLVVALRKLGYIEGENILIDFRWADGKNERFPELAAELVALKPDAIVAETTPGAIAVQRATASIPIVMLSVSDPVGSGLIASLARPGSNLTGGTDFGIELATKDVDLVRAIVPAARRVAVLMSDNPVHPSQLKAIESVATKASITIYPIVAKSFEEFEPAFATMARQNVQALIVLGGPPFATTQQRDKLIELVAKARVPAIYPGRFFPEGGGLLSYGTSFEYRIRLAAAYVDKILKGGNPAEMPVQQPTEFELVVNMKTAKTLGVTIPQSLLLSAEVIQ